MTLRPALAACLLGLLVVPSHARADDPPAPVAPLHAFAAWPAQIVPGPPLRAPGMLLVPLLRDPGLQQAVPDARVGLQDVDVDVLDLPHPAGALYVRITNQTTSPVELTVGEALITPDGPSRIVSRPAYLPPLGSAMVPTASGLDVRCLGPYVSRGLGLSPREQGMLEARTWPAELRARNTQLGVLPTRVLDASAGYLTPAFLEAATRYEQRLAPLRGPRCVGVAAWDERGLAYVRLAADAARFHEHLVFLERELILDAVRAQATGRKIPSLVDAAMHADVRALLRNVESLGVAHASFAGSAIHRWDVPARGGRWEGLSVDGAPWSLTWVLRAVPPPVQPGPPAPPTPPDPPEPPTPPAAPGVISRDPRPSAFEERLNDRRNEAGGGRPGSGGAAGGGTGGGGSGGGGAGGGGGGGVGGGGGGGLR